MTTIGMTTQESLREDSIMALRDALPEGSIVHIVIRSVARSGMSRRMTLHYTIPVEGREQAPIIVDCTRRVAMACEWSVNDTGMLVQGCGMDMGFHAVYTLAQVLHADGYSLSHRYI